MATLFTDKDAVKVRAYFLGQQFSLQSFTLTETISIEPLMVTVGESGCAVLFGYGAAILLYWNLLWMSRSWFLQNMSVR